MFMNKYVKYIHIYLFMERKRNQQKREGENAKNQKRKKQREESDEGAKEEEQDQEEEEQEEEQEEEEQDQEEDEAEEDNEFLDSDRYEEHGFTNVGLRNAVQNFFSGNTWGLPPMSQWNVGNVTDMSGLFQDIPALKQQDGENLQTVILPISTWDVLRVTTMKQMFAGCNNFTADLDIWKVENVRDMDGMFEGCRKFSSDLIFWRLHPAITTEKIAMLFRDCPIIAEDSWPTLYVPRSHLVPPPLQLPAERHQNNDPMFYVFTERYPDYIPFRDFLRTYLMAVAPKEYQEHYVSIGPSFFLQQAPHGYSFNDIPSEIVQNQQDNPFFQGLKYIYSILPRFSPSPIAATSDTCTEYIYSITVNRLIYYYNLWMATNNEELEGFGNSAGIIILTHGVHPFVNDFVNLTPDNPSTPLKNLYICSKASLGCFSYNMIFSKLLSTIRNQLASNMYYQIDTFGSFAFDEESLLPGFDRFPRSPLDFPQCRLHRGENALGDAMRNRIFPRVDGFLEKQFISVEGEEDYVLQMILDVEKLEEVKKHYNIDDFFLIFLIGSSIRKQKQEQLISDIKPYFKILRQANILFDPSLHVVKERARLNTKTKRYEFDNVVTMSSIVDYYNRKGKTNLFVYDGSCAEATELEPDRRTYIQTLDERLPKEERPKLGEFVARLEAMNQDQARQGRGRTRRRRRRRNRRTVPKRNTKRKNAKKKNALQTRKKSVREGAQTQRKKR
jgi:surface protein